MRQHPRGDAGVVLGQFARQFGRFGFAGPQALGDLGADEFPLPYEYGWFDLEGVVSKVPDDVGERTIVYLRFFEGLTQSEIAERIGISQMHVSRLLRAALDSLRDELGPVAA